MKRAAFEALEPRRLLTALAEVEPNDFLSEANDLQFQTVANAPVFARTQAFGRATGEESDFYRLRVYGGDVLDIRLEVQASAHGTPDLCIRDAKGNELLRERTSSRFEDQFLFEVPVDGGGIYFVELEQHRESYEAEYLLTILRSRGGSSEPGRDFRNGAIDLAMEFPFDFADDFASESVFGSLRRNLDDESNPDNWDQDLFRLGTREAGDTIRIEGLVPSWSDADPIIEIRDWLGQTLSSYRIGDEPAETVFDERGDYHLLVSATGPGGPDSQYVLRLELQESIAPSVLAAAGLPHEQDAAERLFANFELEFSEPVRPVLWSDQVGELREAGVDAVFGTSDDAIIDLRANWSSDSAATFLILDEFGENQTLRPGTYQFSLGDELIDRSGNRSLAFQRSFHVPQLPDSTTLKLDPNLGFKHAQELPLRSFDASPDKLISDVGIGLVGNCHLDDDLECSDWWRVELQAGDRFSVTTQSDDSNLVYRVHLHRQLDQQSDPVLIETMDSSPGEFEGYWIRDHYVDQDATYYVSISGSFCCEIERDIQYETQVEVQRFADPGFPEIAEVRSLPRPNTSAERLIDRFTIDLVNAVDPESIRQDGVEVIETGADGLFDTADDTVIPAVAELLHPPWRIEVEFLGGPLTPGAYRVRFADLVSDRQGNRLDSDSNGVEGGTFSRSFNVPEIPPGHVFEATPFATLELHQDESGTELWRADIGYGSIAKSTDVDWWKFDVLAGDQIVVDGISTDGSTLGAGIGVAVKLYAMADDGITIEELSEEQFTGGRAGAGSARAIALSDATWMVKVSQHNPDQMGGYEVRVNAARTSQFEEDFPTGNWGGRSPEQVALSPMGGAAIARLSGLLTSPNDGDTWSLGYLQAGALVSVDASIVPDWSDASPVVQIRSCDLETNTLGPVLDDENLSEAVASVTIASDGHYCLRVFGSRSAGAGETGLDAAYLAAVRIAETIPPRIESTEDFPVGAPIHNSSFSSFSITFSEHVDLGSLTEESIVVRGPGPDRRFDTGDDVLFSLTPHTFDDERRIGLTIDAGPLTVGLYRIDLNEMVTDLAGNGLDANGDGESGGVFSYPFRVGFPPENHVIEQPLNDSFDNSTLLEFGPSDPGGTGWTRTTIGWGIIAPGTDVDWWAIDAEAGQVADFHVFEYRYQTETGLELSAFQYDEANETLVELATSIHKDGVTQISTLRFPSTGRYYLRVSSPEGKSRTEYELVGQSNTTYQMEQERELAPYSGELIGAVEFSSGTGLRHAFVAGSHSGSSDPDRYSLGYLLPGDVVYLDVSRQSDWAASTTSDLPTGDISSAKSVTANSKVYLRSSRGCSSGSHDGVPVDEYLEDDRVRSVITQAGYYHALVTGYRFNAILQEPAPQYLLEIAVEDSTPLSVVDVTGLPENGSLVSDAIAEFSVEFNGVPRANTVTADRFRLINAGPDESFGTEDDLHYPLMPSIDQLCDVPRSSVSVSNPEGPLADGLYRFEIDASVMDSSGNGLDGDGDLVAGGKYVQEFTLDAVSDGAIFEGPTNDSFLTGVAIPVVADSNGTGWKASPTATGFLERVGDEDWWVFSAKEGDRIDVVAHSDRTARWTMQIGYWDETRGVPVVIEETSMFSTFGWDRDRTLRFRPILAPIEGDYYVRFLANEKVTSGGFEASRYDFLVGNQAQFPINEEDVSPGIDSESVERLRFQSSGGQSIATVAGSLIAGSEIPIDRDAFEIGGVEEGQAITIQVQTASWTIQRSLVTVVGPNGWQLEQAVLSSASEPITLIAKMDGTYRVYLNSYDTAALDGHYRLDVTIDGELPMAVLEVDAPSIASPPLLDPRNDVTLSWTTNNSAYISTQDDWIQRILFSESSDGRDAILLGTFVYDTVLKPDQPIRRTETISLANVDLDGRRGYFVIETELEASSTAAGLVTQSVATDEVVFGHVLSPGTDGAGVSLSSEQAAQYHEFLIADRTTMVRFEGDWEVLPPSRVENTFLHHVQANGVRIALSNFVAGTNPVLHEDVDRTGSVTPLDALLIINRLGRAVSDQDHVAGDFGEGTHRYYDTNGDGMVSPRDALAVINRIARLSLGEGERRELRHEMLVDWAINQRDEWDKEPIEGRIPPLF